MNVEITAPDDGGRTYTAAVINGTGPFKYGWKIVDAEWTEWSDRDDVELPADLTGTVVLKLKVKDSAGAEVESDPVELNLAAAPNTQPQPEPPNVWSWPVAVTAAVVLVIVYLVTLAGLW